MTDFGQRLRELRKKFGVTQVELAEAVGLSQTVISDYEKGKAMPTAPVIVKIAKYFGVSTDYLLGLEDESVDKLPKHIEIELKKLNELRKDREILLKLIDHLRHLLENL